jgi:hypothetical protein
MGKVSALVIKKWFRYQLFIKGFVIENNTGHVSNTKHKGQEYVDKIYE